MPDQFLPITMDEVRERGWQDVDFVCVNADAYVDHPSFGMAIISRVLEAAGFRVAILAQPKWRDDEDFRRFGRPRLGFMVSGGNIDSMVNHYTASKKKRSDDSYSPGGKAGYRPDRATIVYCNRIREAYGDIPIIIGGIEASLRRFAHYDYWSDNVRKSILIDSSADILIYGMGERAVREAALRLAAGEDVRSITNIRGTSVIVKNPEESVYPYVFCPSFEEVRSDKRKYAESCKIQYDEQDHIRGKAILQAHDKALLLQNPPQAPLSTEEMDAVYALPYTRRYHPCYENAGGIPAIEKVEFSIAHNRGCFGNCNFCALAFHQGKVVTSRSEASIIKEAEGFTKNPRFKGYIHDVGGPTANFRHPACKKQMKAGTCKDKRCLSPIPCKNLEVSHDEYLHILDRLCAIKGIKKVFIRSGIRYDYLMLDKNDAFFRKLVQRHISGQLKVAPEHCAPSALNKMGKPDFKVYRSFYDKFYKLNQQLGLKQFLVPYFMSSHPGCTVNDAIELAQYLKEIGYSPEQVQDFYPTPGTISTCMFYTGIDPMTMKSVTVPRTPKEKATQRALLQFRRPENYTTVYAALKEAGREDLIGFGKDCLIRPPRSAEYRSRHEAGKTSGDKTPRKTYPQKDASRKDAGKGNRGRGAAPAGAKAAVRPKGKTGSKPMKAEGFGKGRGKRG